MNEITLIRDAGPDAPPLTSTAFAAARAALLAEIDDTPVGREPASVIAARQLVDDARTRRRPRATRGPRRRMLVLGLGAAGLTAAAALVATALVPGNRPAAPPSVTAPPTREVALVDFDLPAFPLTLSTPPPSAGRPVFGGAGDGGASVSFTSTADAATMLSITVVPVAPPPAGSVGYPGSAPRHITIHGTPAVLVAPEDVEGAVGSLDWERKPGQWVILQGQGRYADPSLLIALAAGLVDRPQAMPVQLHLAPAGYRLDFFKDDGRVVRLTDGTDPYRGLTVRLPFAGETSPIQQLPHPPGSAPAPVVSVTVQGQPAQLVRTDLGGGGKNGWFLQARLPGGTTVVVEAPGDLTQDQLVGIADGVTYTP